MMILTNNTEWTHVMSVLDDKIESTRRTYESMSTEVEKLSSTRARLNAYTTLKKQLEEDMENARG